MSPSWRAREQSLTRGRMQVLAQVLVVGRGGLPVRSRCLLRQPQTSVRQKTAQKGNEPGSGGEGPGGSSTGPSLVPLWELALSGGPGWRGGEREFLEKAWVRIFWQR